MNRTLSFIGILIIVILVSGCLEGNSFQDQTLFGDGLVITDFYANNQPLAARDSTLLLLDIENRGEFQAENINPELIRKGAFEVEDIDIIPRNLSSPIGDTVLSDEFSWKITAPPITQSRSEELQARVWYDYIARGSVDINLVPYNILEDRGVSSFSDSSYSTFTPIKLDLSVNQPVSIYEDEIADLYPNVDSFNRIKGIGRAANYCPETMPASIYNYLEKAIQGTSSSTCSDSRDYLSVIPKDVRLSLLINNRGGGRVDSSDLEIPTLCPGKKSVDCLKELTIDSKDCPFVSIVSTSDGVETEESLPKTFTSTENDGLKLIQGNQARRTYNLRFYISDVDAYTKCTIDVSAKYRYRLDSPITSVQIKSRQ